MADNFLANPGAGGDTFAADDVGGVKYPYSKIDVGADGASSPVTAANPMPVGGASLSSLAATVATVDDAAGATPTGQLMTGIRRDAETSPVSADGDYHPFVFNDGGRLKVSVTPADIPNSTGSIIASGGVVALQVKRLSNLAISMVGTSLVGHNATFEASNNSTNGTDGNWYTVQVVRSNANTVETATGVLAATPAYMWQVNVSDYGYFRVRATAHTSGTAAYILNPSAYVSEPIPAVQVTGTQPISGTVTATVATTTNIPATAQGSSTHHHLISAATTNATSVKASAGVINCIVLSNDSAAKKYFKLYNKASAPTVGTDTPILTVVIPPGDTRIIDCGPFGIRLATGIAYAITGAIAVADTTAVALSEVAVHIDYT